MVCCLIFMMTGASRGTVGACGKELFSRLTVRSQCELSKCIFSYLAISKFSYFRFCSEGRLLVLPVPVPINLLSFTFHQ